jgi:pyrroline-5-carboxylate reductase
MMLIIINLSNNFSTIMVLGIIGAGVMGEVFVSALVNQHVFKSTEIMVSGRNQTRLANLGKRYGVSVTTNNSRLVTASDLIILAVKPQSSTDLFPTIKGQIKKSAVVISIMAGIPICKIQKGINHSAIIRTMPNTPAQAGEGMTVWMATKTVTTAQKSQVRLILQALGQEMEVENEDLLDAATAITGSGPAYLFYLAENIIKTAVELGFSEDQAQILVKQLFTGSAKLMRESADSPHILRQKVTSKGGTTAAAVAVMNTEKMPEIVQRAIKAAYARAGELRFG